jgi:hypothetical protein
LTTDKAHTYFLSGLKMTPSKFWAFVLVASVLVLVGGLALADCPEVCTCKWKGGKQTVECINASLSSIPEIEAGTQVLDLTLNYLPSLNTDIFSKLNLRNLQKIYLPRCSLRNLEEHTFRYSKMSSLHNSLTVASS